MAEPDDSSMPTIPGELQAERQPDETMRLMIDALPRRDRRFNDIGRRISRSRDAIELTLRARAP